MKAFMDKDFLLETATAQHLFHDYSEKLPLVDYHCHLNPKEIYEDRRFENLAQVWLGGLQPDGSFAQISCFIIKVFTENASSNANLQEIHKTLGFFPP